MTQMWTPDRDIPLNVQDREAMRPGEMAVIEQMHDIAQRHGIQLRCAKCGVNFQGLNSGAKGRTQSIFCKCREIKANTGSGIVRV